MERCDFSSISTCLKNQISESNQMNQPDFLYELFEDFMNDPINEDFSMCKNITLSQIYLANPQYLSSLLCNSIANIKFFIVS